MPTSSGGGGVDFVEQLKLLPFLVRGSASLANGSRQLEAYEHAMPYGPPLWIAQFPQGVGCAAEGGRPAWQWRVWDASKAIATVLAELEASVPGTVRGSVVMELGSGAGLASLAAARLGASAVVATDMPRALPLTIHNLQANGGVVASTCPRSAGGVRCPGGHRLKRLTAKNDDHVCNVCGLADPLSGGIERGTTVHCCRACDFDVCGACADAAGEGAWARLPGWFELQCQGGVEGLGMWRMAEEGQTGAPPVDARPMVMVAPWDLLSAAESPAANKLANGKRAAELVEACVVQAGAPPSLVLVADLSCSAALIQPLVDSLVALGASLLPGAVAIVAHERREAKVDSALAEAIALAGLIAEPLRVPEHLLAPPVPADAKKKQKKKGELPATSRLQMWRVQLRCS